MQFKAQIKMDNAAFSDEPGVELARILRELAKAVEMGADVGDCGNVRDVNGNTVGEYRISR